MADRKPVRIKSIAEFHQVRGLPKPLHPLVSVVSFENFTPPQNGFQGTCMLDFYSISIKRAEGVKYKYGQQRYDFDDGVMFFIAPGQIFGIEPGPNHKRSGWMLLFHPDFLWRTTLAKSIKKYEYFNYSVSEALFLSEKEESVLIGILQNIEQEYSSNIDRFSQDIIIAQIEVLLNFSERYYHRQFLTRKITNHQLLEQLEKILDDYFNEDQHINQGLPTVHYIADKLNVSPNYLSSVLKVLTNQSTQQHIHDKLIRSAKEKLSTTELTVSEIAYELGFEHPQSFSKLFKSKTRQSPLEFRKSFD